MSNVIIVIRDGMEIIAFDSAKPKSTGVHGFPSMFVTHVDEHDVRNHDDDDDDDEDDDDDNAPETDNAVSISTAALTSSLIEISTVKWLLTSIDQSMWTVN